MYMSYVSTVTCQNGYLVSTFLGKQEHVLHTLIQLLEINCLLTGKDKNLSWIQRLQIALGSACGLWFLHIYPEGCIVHRDVKVGCMIWKTLVHLQI